LIIVGNCHKFHTPNLRITVWCRQGEGWQQIVRPEIWLFNAQAEVLES